MGLTARAIATKLDVESHVVDTVLAGRSFTQALNAKRCVCGGLIYTFPCVKCAAERYKIPFKKDADE